MTDPLRLAMWSGPRNVSTALMRSWENRGDTAVVDEPFYAYYLASTGLPHPMAAEVIAHDECDWRVVAESLTKGPAEAAIHYQKQMAHHLLPDVGRDWLSDVKHAFLIREPKGMLLSLEVKLGEFRLVDTGLPQQVEIFDFVMESTAKTPPVIDSQDLLENPRGMLKELCHAVGVEFTDRMLRWPPGRRESDGIWAAHWYDSVERSTGFQPYRPRSGHLPAHLAELEQECRPYYEKLYERRLTVA